jgi:peptidyl-prolyl cis-trans isomerase D
MYDFVHNHKRMIQIVLGIIFLPFAFFGVDSYFRQGEGAEVVATVGDQKITQQEFSRALRERQEALQSMGRRVDPAQFETTEFRQAVLEGLIRQRLLIERAVRAGMTVTAQQLQAVIGAAPAFAEDGKFSFQRYQQFLKANNMTPVIFESRVRQDLLIQQVDDAYTGANFMPRTVAERLTRISEEQREVSQSAITPERFVPQVKLEEGAAKKYYDAHPDAFRVPEQVRIEYVALTQEAVLSQIPLAAEEVRKYYDEHMKQYEVKEARQASHILIAADAAAAADVKQKARAKAEEIAARVRQNPATFAALAKENSQDPGSAVKGGDLGFFQRGSMVKPFDDAVFQAKAGDILGPVESQYGYHVIRVVAVRPPQVRSFEEARGEIEAEMKKQLAAKKFAESAEALNNIVFEQSDSLKPAADLLKSPVKQSGWISRTGSDVPMLNNPRLLQSLFSEDVLANKRNTEAIEVGPGTIVAARLLEHKPASLRPFDQVSADIERRLTLERAAQLAAQEGRAYVEKLRKGETVNVTWTAPQLVSRVEPAKDLSPAVMRQAFKVGTAKLPAYSGVENPQGGYLLVRVTRVAQPEKASPEKQKALTEGLQQVLGQEEFSAYLASLKQKAAVKIKPEALEKKAQ